MTDLEKEVITVETAAIVNPRKRRNRWGEFEETTVNTLTTISSFPDNQEIKNESSTTEAIESTVENAEENVKKTRKSRWALTENVPNVAFLPGFSALTAPLSEEVIQQTVVLKLQLAQVNQKLLTVTQDALLIEQDPHRSPSPPPKYDSSGKRTNTREVRMRESLNAQRIKIIKDLMKVNPTFQPPLDFVKAKPFRKIYIPKNNDPTCNYIGLIIGPRGNTQKQMEQETQCKISIRGKGSAKEGSKGRQTKQVDEDDELHVHIQGDYEENVDRAAQMIALILGPFSEKLNEHKQRQLRQLAVITGSFKEDDYCPICAEKGHRQFDCPYRAKSFKAAGVKCSICGDLSHPTRDCPLKERGIANDQNLDTEYDNFLSEVGGEKRGVTGPGGDAGGDSLNPTIPPPRIRGQGPVVLQPIVDVVSRNPAMMNMAAALFANTVPAVAAVATTPIYADPALASAGTVWPAYSGSASVNTNPYPQYDYSSYYAAAASDPAAYAAYVEAYNQYATALGTLYPSNQPPPS